MATTQLIPNNYRLHMANQFVESFNEAANTLYYMFSGTSTPFSGGVVPPILDTPNATQFNAYNNMLFGKHIRSSDVSLMAYAYPWTSGTSYSMYDDTDITLPNKSFYVYVYQSNTYYVFKCLYNNSGGTSTQPPTFADTSASDTYYKTSDGYIWKYMYQIDSTTFNKFATNQYIPIVADSNVTANAVPGAVDIVVVQSGGTGYNNYFSGKFYAGSVTNGTQPLCVLANTASSVNNYYNGCYLYITGGTGSGQYRKITSHSANNLGTYVTLDSAFASIPDNTTTYDISPAVVILNSSDTAPTTIARALVNSSISNSIYQVQVLNRGSGVYNAGAYVYASNAVGVSNTAVIRVISGPTGGHGANVGAELYSSRVGLSVKFSNTESNTIPSVNDYQTIGILKDPLFSNVVFTTTGLNGSFQVGETITQSIANVSANITTTATGIVVATSPGSLQVTNASGSFALSTNSSVGTIIGQTSAANAQISAILNNGVSKYFETFVQMYSYAGSYTGAYAFTPNEVVYQGTSNTTPAPGIQSIATSNAVFFSNNAAGTQVYLTSKLGPLYSSATIQGVSSGAIFNINTSTSPDLVMESGQVLYLENFDAVSRSGTQSETIKLILEY